MTNVMTDQIEESVTVDAAPSRVWRVLTDPHALGRLLGLELPVSEFTPGGQVKAKRAGPPHEGIALELVVETMHLERVFSWHWHPFAVVVHHDYAAEPMTLVILELLPAGAGTRLTLVETGFDRLASPRREEALDEHRRAWHEFLSEFRRVAVA